MLKYFFILFILASVVVITIAGPRGQRNSNRPIQIFPDMKWQPRVDPQAPSVFFGDGRSQRAPVAGTVPIGFGVPGSKLVPHGKSGAMRAEVGLNPAFSSGVDYANTGKFGDNWGDGFPIEVTHEVMARGRERYTINCAICHGQTAAGDGIVKQYGLNTVATLQDDRVRAMPDGEIFNTISNGKNTMMAYGDKIPVPDRWAIIAYLRALQISQHGAIAEVPAAEREALEKK